VYWSLGCYWGLFLVNVFLANPTVSFFSHILTFFAEARFP